MTTGGGPEVPGHPRDQAGQILQGLEQIGSVGDSACMGVPKENDVAHYGLGTRDKADYPVC
jgi:hypothetical protein